MLDFNYSFVNVQKSCSLKYDLFLICKLYYIFILALDTFLDSAQQVNSIVWINDY